MNTPPKVAVVILNWNGVKYLEQFLPSVVNTRFANMEVIIADNGSTDGSVAFLRQYYPQLRLILFSQNFGFAKGYNEALRQVEAEYYVLLNSDVEVPTDWLDPMISLLDSDQMIAACQPKILSFRDKTSFDYAGAAGGWLDQFGYPFAKGRIFDICEKDMGQYDQQEPIFWASGAALCIRASVFHEVKGFDEYFFAHQEEIDLCWRIQLSGYFIYACPASKVYHIGGGTLPRGNTLKTFLNFRNNRIMLSKNLPFRKKIWIIPLRYILDGISAWKGLLTGDAGYFLVVFKAQIAFINWWFFHQKKSVFPLQRNKPLHGFFKRNLAWLHFIKKCNRFSEIVTRSR